MRTSVDHHTSSGRGLFSRVFRQLLVSEHQPANRRSAGIVWTILQVGGMVGVIGSIPGLVVWVGYTLQYKPPRTDYMGDLFLSVLAPFFLCGFAGILFATTLRLVSSLSKQGIPRASALFWSISSSVFTAFAVLSLMIPSSSGLQLLAVQAGVSLTFGLWLAPVVRSLLIPSSGIPRGKHAPPTEARD